MKDNFKSYWDIHRYRTDKTTPNHFTVAMNVLQCLDEVAKIINNKESQ